MVDFLKLESSGLGSRSSDPVMAAINGESADGERSPLDFSAESSDISEKIVPMSGPDPLELDKPIGEDEFVREARRAGTDPVTGSDERAIQTRSGSDPGNNRRRAYDIGTLNGNESYSDSVSRRDRRDFYEFSVDSRGRVEIDLSGLSDNADLYLHNSRGKAIKKSRRSGTASESISRILNPGDYYVQVKSRSKWDSTDYDLELNFSELTPDHAGNNRRKARGLGSLGSTQSYSDFVGRGDRNDFYTFTLDGEKDVNISMDGLSGNADLHLFKKGTRGVAGRSTNSGSSSESINESLGAGTYYLRVKSKGGAGTDYSLSLEATGKVEPPPPPPPPSYYIDVTSPNGGETWESGNTINIGWGDNISENVKIDLYKGGVFQSTISSSTESDGSYSWTIPAGLAVGSDYNIKVASTSDGNIHDFGDGNFTVEAEPAPPPPPPSYYINVASPNGGEAWEAGNIVNIAWSDNISENVKIDLYKGGSLSSTISSSTESDGSYSWTVPTSLAEGSDYNIKITSTSDGNIYDDGDGNFTVEVEVEVEPPPPPPPEETVDERKEWRGWVSKWNASSGAPSPVNINENTSFELVGQLNLGSNISEVTGDGRHGINNADWGAGSVKGYSQLPTDNFLVKAYTEVDLEGSQTYEFEAKGDDGYQIWLKNLDTNEWSWVTPENEWQSTVGQAETDKFTHTIPGDKGGRYYVGFFHSENTGDAYFGLNWRKAPIPIEDTTGSDWRGSFYRFDGSPPSTNFHENEADKLAVLNLGRGDDKSFSGDWGTGSPNSEYIPSDNFALRSYTHAYFENGKQYEFNVSADDGYQIFAKHHGTNDWFDVTTKNEWSTDAYGGKTISHTWAGPTGNYDLHFQHYEITGDAYFNLDWKDVSPSNDFKVPLPAGWWKVTQGAKNNGITGFHKESFSVDFANGKSGDPVLAAASGKVITTSFDAGGYGNYVEIDHDNGYQTLYAHFRDFPQVTTGQFVNQGDRLGVVGNTGDSSGPHLHFEVKYNNSRNSVPELQNFTLDGRQLLDYKYPETFTL